MKKEIKIKLGGATTGWFTWGDDAYSRIKPNQDKRVREDFICKEFVQRFLKKAPKLALFEVSDCKFEGSQPVCVMREGISICWYNVQEAEIAEMFPAMAETIESFLGTDPHTVIHVKVSERKR